VLSSGGRSVRIVRPWSALTETPSSGEGVPILLPGSPGLALVLDRDYWAVVVTRPEQHSASWMLTPKDEQSTLNIDVALDDPRGSLDALLDDADSHKHATGPGPPRQPETVGGKAVGWLRWSDRNELYSSCEVGLAAENERGGRTYNVRLRVTANTEERRQALEERLASLRLSFSAPPSGGGPKN
jgi:hypothetical protein